MAGRGGRGGGRERKIPQPNLEKLEPAIQMAVKLLARAEIMKEIEGGELDKDGLWTEKELKILARMTRQREEEIASQPEKVREAVDSAAKLQETASELDDFAVGNYALWLQTRGQKN